MDKIVGDVHEAISSEFQRCARVSFSGAHRSNWWPTAWVEERDDLKILASMNTTNYKSDLEEDSSESKERLAYLYGLFQGEELGYPVVGDKWLLLLGGGDASHFSYIPVENVREVKSIAPGVR